MVNNFTAKLSEQQLSLLSTQEDVLFCKEHSWYISPKLLSDQIIDETIAFISNYKYTSVGTQSNLIILELF